MNYKSVNNLSINLRPGMRTKYNLVSRYDIPKTSYVQEEAIYCSIEVLFLLSLVLDDIERELVAANVCGPNQRKCLAKMRQAFSDWKVRVLKGNKELEQHIINGMTNKEAVCFNYYQNLAWTYAVAKNCSIPRVFGVHFAAFELATAHKLFIRIYNIQPEAYYVCNSMVTAVEALLDGIRYDADERIVYDYKTMPGLETTRTVFLSELAKNACDNWRKWDEAHQFVPIAIRNSWLHPII